MHRGIEMAGNSRGVAHADFAGRVELTARALPGDPPPGGATILGVARTVRDTAALLDATHGHLPGEPCQLAKPDRPYVQEVGADPGHRRIVMVTATPDRGTPV